MMPSALTVRTVPAPLFVTTDTTYKRFTPTTYQQRLTVILPLTANMSGETSACPPILAHLILSNVSIGATMGAAYVGAVLSAM